MVVIMAYDDIKRDTKTQTINIKTYYVDGIHTCMSWYGSSEHAREACMFLGSMKFGTVNVCMFLESLLYEYDGGKYPTLLKPDCNCPLINDNGSCDVNHNVLI